jgi:hypothetical protein
LELVSQALKLSLLCGSFSCVYLLNVILDSFLVRIRRFVHPAFDHVIGVAPLLLKLLDEGLCLIEEPGENVALEALFDSLVVEEARVFQEGEAVALNVSQVLLGNCAGDDLLVGLDLGHETGALQTLLGIVGYEAINLFLLHFLDVGFLHLGELSELLLLLGHLLELFFLEHLHAGALERLSAEHRQDGLDLVVKDEKFIVFNESFL